MADQIIYKPGDPKETRYVQQLLLISGLIGVSTSMWLTSTHYKAVMDEFEAQYRDALMDPTRPAPWDTRTDRFQIGAREPFLTVINSGTEDEEVVYLLNEEPARVAEFGARRDALIRRSIADVEKMTRDDKKEPVI